MQWLNQQSMRGKTIDAITSLGREKNIPIVGPCGKLELEEQDWKRIGLLLVASLSDGSNFRRGINEKGARVVKRKD